jgi:hypothetical protein
VPRDCHMTSAKPENSLVEGQSVFLVAKAPILDFQHCPPREVLSSNRYLLVDKIADTKMCTCIQPSGRLSGTKFSRWQVRITYLFIYYITSSTSLWVERPLSQDTPSKRLCDGDQTSVIPNPILEALCKFRRFMQSGGSSLSHDGVGEFNLVPG